MSAFRIYVLALLCIGLVGLTGCRTTTEDQETARRLAELRESFPIRIGDSVSTLPTQSMHYKDRELALVRSVPSGGEEPDRFTFIVIGKQNGMCRIYVSASKVIRIDFAWGSKEAGPFSDFIRLF